MKSFAKIQYVHAKLSKPFGPGSGVLIREEVEDFQHQSYSLDIVVGNSHRIWVVQCGRGKGSAVCIVIDELKPSTPDFHPTCEHFFDQRAATRYLFHAISRIHLKTATHGTQSF